MFVIPVLREVQRPGSSVLLVFCFLRISYMYKEVERSLFYRLMLKIPVFVPQARNRDDEEGG